MAINDLKVANVINSLNIGGAEKILTQFAIKSKYLFKLPVDIIILYQKNFFSNILEEENIKVKKLVIWPKYNFFLLKKLYKVLKEGEYSIIHVHLFPTSLFVAIASFFLNKQPTLIFTEHSVRNRRRMLFYFKILDKFIYSRYKKIVCVSKRVEDELNKWLPALSKKTVVITNGIEIPQLKKHVVKEYDIIFTGRLIHTKGVDILLKAIELLKNKNVLKKVAIVGNGPLFHSLQKKVYELKIGDIVNFLGRREDVNGLLQTSRIYVLPSRWEGIPLSLLEAMAVELPVIASNVGGIPEVIDDGIDGILVPPEDSDSLAYAIEKILSDANLANTLGKNARKKIEQNYPIEQYTNKILDLYEKLSTSH